MKRPPLRVDLRDEEDRDRTLRERQGGERQVKPSQPEGRKAPPARPQQPRRPPRQAPKPGTTTCYVSHRVRSRCPRTSAGTETPVPRNRSVARGKRDYAEDQTGADGREKGAPTKRAATIDNRTTVTLPASD